MWKLKKRNLIYKNKFGYELYDDDVVTPAGKDGKYMVLELPGFVTIVALNEKKEVILIKQWRHPVGKEFIELPAGTMSKGEDPLSCAQRELSEECGALSNNWNHLSSYWSGNGAMKIQGHVYLALNIEMGRANQEEVEEINSNTYGFADVVKMVESGEIDEERTLVGILLAEKYLNSH